MSTMEALEKDDDEISIVAISKSSTLCITLSDDENDSIKEKVTVIQKDPQTRNFPDIVPSIECNNAINAQENISNNQFSSGQVVNKNNLLTCSNSSKIFKCLTCNIPCNDMQDFFLHYRSVHSDKTSVSCSSCHLVFTTVDKFLEHIKRQKCHQIEFYKCPSKNCSFKTSLKNLYHNHIGKCGQIKYYLCPYCNEKFTSPDSMLDHLNNQCGKLDSDNSTLNVIKDSRLSSSSIQVQPSSAHVGLNSSSQNSSLTSSESTTTSISIQPNNITSDLVSTTSNCPPDVSRVSPLIPPPADFTKSYPTLSKTLNSSNIDHSFTEDESLSTKIIQNTMSKTRKEECKMNTSPKNIQLKKKANMFHSNQSVSSTNVSSYPNNKSVILYNSFEIVKLENISEGSEVQEESSSKINFQLLNASMNENQLFQKELEKQDSNLCTSVSADILEKSNKASTQYTGEVNIAEKCIEGDKKRSADMPESSSIEKTAELDAISHNQHKGSESLNFINEKSCNRMNTCNNFVLPEKPVLASETSNITIASPFINYIERHPILCKMLDSDSIHPPSAKVKSLPSVINQKAFSETTKEDCCMDRSTGNMQSNKANLVDSNQIVAPTDVSNLPNKKNLVLYNSFEIVKVENANENPKEQHEISEEMNFKQLDTSRPFTSPSAEIIGQSNKESNCHIEELNSAKKCARAEKNFENLKIDKITDQDSTELPFQSSIKDAQDSKIMQRDLDIHSNKSDSRTGEKREDSKANEQLNDACNITSQEWRHSDISLLLKSTLAYTAMKSEEKLKHFFKCMDKDCSFTTDKRMSFSNHVRMHKHKSMICIYCLNSFSAGFELATHLSKCHNSLNFQCQFCFYRACSKDHIIIHALHVHSVKYHSGLVCNPVRSSSQEDLETNFYKVKSYVCSVPFCSFEVGDSKNYKMHLLYSHEDRKKFKCHECEISFQSNQIDSLIEHYIIHNYCLFHCCYCGLGTVTQKKMLLHIVDAHNNRKISFCVRKNENDIQISKINSNAQQTEKKILSNKTELDNFNSSSEGLKGETSPSSNSEVLTATLKSASCNELRFHNKNEKNISCSSMDENPDVPKNNSNERANDSNSDEIGKKNLTDEINISNSNGSSSYSQVKTVHTNSLEVAIGTLKSSNSKKAILQINEKKNNSCSLAEKSLENHKKDSDESSNNTTVLVGRVSKDKIIQVLTGICNRSLEGTLKESNPVDKMCMLKKTENIKRCLRSAGKIDGMAVSSGMAKKTENLKRCLRSAVKIDSLTVSSGMVKKTKNLKRCLRNVGKIDHEKTNNSADKPNVNLFSSIDSNVLKKPENLNRCLRSMGNIDRKIVSSGMLKKTKNIKRCLRSVGKIDLEEKINYADKPNMNLSNSFDSNVSKETENLKSCLRSAGKIDLEKKMNYADKPNMNLSNSFDSNVSKETENLKSCLRSAGKIDLEKKMNYADKPNMNLSSSFDSNVSKETENLKKCVRNKWKTDNRIPSSGMFKKTKCLKRCLKSARKMHRKAICSSMFKKTESFRSKIRKNSKETNCSGGKSSVILSNSSDSNEDLKIPKAVPLTPIDDKSILLCPLNSSTSVDNSASLERYLECTLCLKDFSSMKDIVLHLSSQHDIEGLFKCSLCNKHTMTKMEMNLHIEAFHSKKSTLIFSYCVEKTREAITYLQKNLICVFCSYSISHKNPDSLRQHLYEEIGYRTLICNVCSKKFMHKKEIEQHFQVKHPSVFVSYKIKSNIISERWVENFIELQLHEKSLYDEEDRINTECTNITSESVFKCIVCHWKSEDAFSAQQHIYWHCLYKPFICGHCEHSFSDFRQLLDHTGNIHKDLNILKSTIVFIENLADVIILSSLSENSSLTCSIDKCSFQTQRMKVLSRHLVSHFAKLKFKCKICYIKGNKKKTIRKHFRNEHRTKKSKSYNSTGCVTSGLNNLTDISMTTESIKNIADNKSIVSTNLIKTCVNKAPDDIYRMSRIYICPHCTLKMTASEIHSHLLSKHPNSEFSYGQMWLKKDLFKDYCFHCVFCEFEGTRSLFARHIITNHYYRYVCSSCDTLYTSSEMLSAHHTYAHPEKELRYLLSYDKEVLETNIEKSPDGDYIPSSVTSLIMLDVTFCDVACLDQAIPECQECASNTTISSSVGVQKKRRKEHKQVDYTKKIKSKQEVDIKTNMPNLVSEIIKNQPVIYLEDVIKSCNITHQT